MKFKPHNYQLQAINYILGHKACALFLDCGLGKTVITLTALAIMKKRGGLKKPVLVIAPKRPAMSTWPNEIKKWDHIFQTLTYAICVGTEKQRIAALKARTDIVIINRENVTWLVNLFGAKWPFETVVIDELSSFKSAKSSRTKSLIRVRNLCQRVIGLTGTPASNGYMDLWAQFRIIDNGERLGTSLTSYQHTYFKPGAKKGYVVYKWYISDWNKNRINKAIQDITLSQRACDFLDMPKYININDVVELDPDELQQYQEFTHTSVMEYEKENGSIDYITAASAGVLAGKLTQFASGSLYTEDKETLYVHEKKYEALEELIEAQNGKPCLVAYWFKADAEKLKDRLDWLGVTWCEIETPEDEEKWNQGGIQVALIHPAKAGHGLNLQEGGNTLIWFSMPWSLELYQQTVARIYRQGQKEGQVLIHHIIAKDTIDERLAKVLGQKDKTQTDLLNAVKQSLPNKSLVP